MEASLGGGGSGATDQYGMYVLHVILCVVRVPVLFLFFMKSKYCTHALAALQTTLAASLDALWE